MRIISGVVG
uniref:Rhoptry associated protein-1 n=1 Tax=Babesia bovis TaxID=5865 RepID=Q27396_BABBO